MEKNKLMTMLDFVFYIRNKTLSELVRDLPNNFKMPIWNGNQSVMVKDMLAIDAIKWRLMGEYGKFLLQRLKLGMFVACDDNDVPLEKPAIYSEWINKNKSLETTVDITQCVIYHRALQKILFKGFEVTYDGVMNYVISNNNFTMTYRKNHKEFEDYLTVNDLAEFKPELSESAIKQIGL